MQNNQMMGVVAALLLVIVILLAVDINQRHHTVGDSLHEAVQDLKDEAMGK